MNYPTIFQLTVHQEGRLPISSYALVAAIVLEPQTLISLQIV